MKKILIADDSSYMRMFIMKIIQKSGLYITLEAGTQEEALEQFKNNKPEIVILDLNMSEYRRDGITVLTEIIKIDPEAAVIIASAVGYEHVKDECIELGAKAYIKKPFDTKELLQLIEQYS